VSPSPAGGSRGGRGAAGPDEGGGDGRELIELLSLEPHPEGGWFRRTWCADSSAGERPSGSAIYYLLCRGEHARQHRVDATEIWHHYLGDPLELVIHPGSAEERRHVLGPDLHRGQTPQVVVPSGAWQRAAALGEFALVGCTVSPAFSYDGFELYGEEGREGMKP
jgi:uncharacterized protein